MSPGSDTRADARYPVGRRRPVRMDDSGDIRIPAPVARNEHGIVARPSTPLRQVPCVSFGGEPSAEPTESFMSIGIGRSTCRCTARPMTERVYSTRTCSQADTGTQDIVFGELYVG